MVDRDKIEQLMYSYFENDREERVFPDDDYVIDEDGAVHVNTSILMFKGTPNKMLPVQFAVVDGDCILADRQLKSLRGSPHTVNGDFDCSHNALTTLQYAPTTIGARASFRCEHNQLTSLAHAPPNADELVCDNNLLTTLTDAPPCHLLWATDNPFVTFKDTPSHIQHVVLSYKPELPLLGLLSVARIEFERLSAYGYAPTHDEAVTVVEEILNRYTGQGKAGQLKCAAELVRRGFKQHARI
jgi:hypothetical protein